MNMSKTLRATLDAASSLEHELRSLTARRRKHFYALSERWQGSKRGDDHMELTCSIEDLARAIELGIENIEEAHE
tara:strand:- start:488 stop:712 length:225 start_codon:yes stop_codon:yes gene_type:complete